MAVHWTLAAFGDLQRIHEFLEPVDPSAAVRSVRAILNRVRKIPLQPRLGEKVPGFGDREVRRVLVSKYEIRNEVDGTNIHVLRVFHTREAR